ncbi:ParA family protein [bacterium]|nr:ParA family protein [bacterium]NBX97600.1 ParA family protein [bacterium]NDC94555.1 ParA family protein [bacterium]NDD84150.1 ParA family protein [bacterium]NDG29963.1 ParA family protein [bacterium]
MITIAVTNQKGGVGKTTTTINLGAYLAKAGKQVLLIDLDPQGNATSGLAIDKKAVEQKTVYELLRGEATAADIVLATEQKNLYILPTTTTLAASEIELVNAQGREFVLKHALANLTYDYILIDCPPSLSLLTVNALTAADKVLIPVQTEFYALEGLGQLIDVVQRVRASVNPHLEILGVVMTMFNSRTSLSTAVKEELTKHFGAKVFNTAIPRNVRLAEAPSYGKTIADHDKWSKGARAYKALAKETIDRTMQ